MREEKKARRPLTYDDRLAIERGLNRGDTISWIARTIGRAPKVPSRFLRTFRQPPRPAVRCGYSSSSVTSR